jgi:hypothetical protein
MDIQEILGKLTEEQKRELLEAAKVAVLESESAPEKAVENKPTKFWTKDRVCTLFAFICSLGLWAFVDSAPWFVLSSIFWAPFAFYKLNPVTIKRTPEQAGKKEGTFINSEGEDITNKCKHLPVLVAIFPICIFVVLCFPGFYTLYVVYNIPEYLHLLLHVAPGYILFFGYAFLSGIPLSALNAAFIDDFHNPLPASEQNGLAKNNPMTFSSIQNNHFSSSDYWSYRRRNGGY